MASQHESTIRRRWPRVFRIELFRGLAAPLAVTLFVILATGLLFYAPWSGNWLGLTMSLRSKLLWAWPVVLAAGVWVSGRDRRRGTQDLLASTSRPEWQRIVVLWATITSAALGGMLLTWLIGAGFVLPFATYSSGDWGLSLLVCTVALGAASAVGMAIGRWAPTSFAALIAGLAALGLTGLAANVDGGARHLVPSLDRDFGWGTTTYSGFAGLTQTAWFAAIALAFLMLIGSRRKWLIIAPTTIGIVAMLGIVSTDPDEFRKTDPVAYEGACTSEGPEVCVYRYQEHLLDDYARVAQPMLRELQGIPGAPTKQDSRTPSNDDLLFTESPIPTLSSSIKEDLAESLSSYSIECKATFSKRTELVHGFGSAGAVATGLLIDGYPDGLGNSKTPQAFTAPIYDGARVQRKLDKLLAQDADARRQWLTQYYAALQACDGPEIISMTQA